ncbi:MAG: saccharopine dehydrogenase C-terminal domain-containing protein [Myxococcota bacterium]
MKTKRIVVLGGGRQGRVVASELAPDYDVTVADVRAMTFKGVTCREVDLADAVAVEKLVGEFDLAVGALPAELGYAAARACVAARKSFVDVAFYPEDAATLHKDAKSAGVAIMPDCGLAPGISNLLVGRALAVRKPRELHIQVGGVAADRTRPFGYVVTWSLDDLVDEFRRPARIRRGGKVVTLPAMSELEPIDIPGVGTLEAFLTDGLRTLLDCDVPEMTEKTMRWPGHIAAIKPLLANGTLRQRLETECREGDDLVAFRVQVDKEIVTMVERPQGGLSAMARTTALTCAAFARLAAEGGVRERGVVPPERIGRDAEAYRFVLDAMAKHGILLTPRYPFLDQ